MTDEIDLPIRPGLTVSLDELASIIDRSGKHDAITFINKKFGNLKELFRLLQTHPDEGISHLPEDVISRKDKYGTNSMYEVEEAGIHASLWRVIADHLWMELRLVVLLLLAVVSFALSFSDSDIYKYEYFLLKDEREDADWVGALALVFLVLFILFFQIVYKYFLDTQYAVTQQKRKLFSMAQVYTIRGSTGLYRPRDDIVVGDVVYIKCGSTVPADGLIIYSSNLIVDERRVTGENKHVRKSAEEDAVLLKGSKIIDGRAKMVVLQVGKRTKLDITRCNEIPLDIPDTLGEQTPAAPQPSIPSYSRISPSQTEHIPKKKKTSLLTEELSLIAKWVKIAAIIVSVLIGVVLLITFIYKTFVSDKREWDVTYMKDIVDLVIVTLSVFTITFPSSLPSIYHRICKMVAHDIMQDQIYVCNKEAYGIMGNITTLLTNKTGVLTENHMRVEEIGILMQNFMIKETGSHEVLVSSLSAAGVLTLLNEGMSVNTDYTSHIIQEQSNEKFKHVGDRTDCALLEFVDTLGGHYRAYRDNNPEDQVTRVYPFKTSRKFMCTVISNATDNYRLYCKGAGDLVLKRCTTFLRDGLEPQPLDAETRVEFVKQMEEMASRKLRTICLAFRDKSVLHEQDEVDWSDEDVIVSDLTCIALLGISDRVRAKAPKDVRDLQKSGIRIIMVTGDVLQTASAVAKEVGIVRSVNDLHLDSYEFNQRIQGLPVGEMDDTTNRVSGDDSLDFSKVVDADFHKTWPRLRVLAQAHPDDKRLLVTKIPDAPPHLQPQLVAVTGRYLGDEDNLLEADLGIALGDIGSVEAKTAADIILKDDSIYGITQAVMWGRNIWDGVVKFVQFQLVRGIVTSLIAFLGACTFSNSPIRAIQILWAYFLVDFSIILLADKPTRYILKYSALGTNNHMISTRFIVTVLSHFAYEATVLITFIYKGASLFDIDDGMDKSPSTLPTQHMTMVFNVFMLMHIFSQFNGRKVHGQKQVYDGLLQMRSLVYLLEFLIQVLIVQYGRYAFGTEPLDIDQWLWCVVFGIGIILWHQIFLLFPISHTSSPFNKSNQ